MPQDFLYRGLFTESNIRFSYALTTEVANTAIQQHLCDPIASNILCRALTAATLCSPQLENDERFSFQWAYDGPLNKINVEACADAKVRGFTYQKNLYGLAESEAELYGEKGFLSVIKTNAKRSLNSGTAEAALFDIVDDLAYYFSVSFQIETDIITKLAFRPDPSEPVEICQGILLQAMPDCDYVVLEKMRANARTESFQKLLSEQPQTDNFFELVIKELCQEINEQPYEIHACNKPLFYCSCDSEKTFNALRTLTKDDVKEIINSDQKARVHCDFCSTTYEFGDDKLKTLLG